MNIALIGYGKMGKAIEKTALERGHRIVLKISRETMHEMTDENIRMADVAIEFTSPDAAKKNVIHCLRAGVPVVCGTTGWNQHVDEAKHAALENETAFLQASNFSVGVNIFFEINTLLASLMNGQEEYKAMVEETHHTQKKDAPSGTAITIAEQIVEQVARLKHWALYPHKKEDADILPIVAHREEDVPGTHRVTYSSAIDDIEIIHTAHNRDGFAQGAVLAAEYIAGKMGIFTMKDVLGIR